jgi:hypothetical protein
LFGWWLMAGADLLWEKSIVGWLLVAGLFWEKSTAVWWLISQTNRLPLFRWRHVSFGMEEMSVSFQSGMDSFPSQNTWKNIHSELRFHGKRREWWHQLLITLISGQWWRVLNIWINDKTHFTIVTLIYESKGTPNPNFIVKSKFIY